MVRFSPHRTWSRSSPPHEARCGLQAAREEEERQDDRDPERPECAPVIVVFVLQVRDQLGAEVLLCDLAVPERPEPGAGVDEAERERVDLLVDVAELGEGRRRQVSEVDPERAAVDVDHGDPALPGPTVDLSPGLDVPPAPEARDDLLGRSAALVDALHIIR